MKRPEYVIDVKCSAPRHRARPVKVATMTRFGARPDHTWTVFDPAEPDRWSPSDLRTLRSVPLTDAASTQVVAEERWSISCPLCPANATRRDISTRPGSMSDALDVLEQRLTSAGLTTRGVVTLQDLAAMLGEFEQRRSST